MKKKGRFRGVELLERHFSINNNWTISKLYIELSALMRVSNELCVNEVDVNTRKSKLNQLIGEEREFLQKLIDSSEEERPQIIIKTEDKEDFHDGDPIPKTPIKQEKTITSLVKTPSTRSASRRSVKPTSRISDVEEKVDQDSSMAVQCTEGSGIELPGTAAVNDGTAADINVTAVVNVTASDVTAAENDGTAADMDGGVASNSTLKYQQQGQIIIPELLNVSNIGLASSEATANDSTVNKDSNTETDIMADEQSKHNEDVEFTNPMDDEDDDYVDDANDADFNMDDEDDVVLSEVEAQVDAPKEPKVKKRKIVNRTKRESNKNQELIQCQECDELVGSIRRHMKRHIMKQFNMCDFCQLSFNSHDILQKHIDTKHNDLNSKTHQKIEEPTRYECEICKRSYLVEDYLAVHIKHCKEFQCTFCPATFREMKEWKLHEEAHKRDCFTCNKTFDTIYDLTNHFNLEHPDNKTLTCFKCNSAHATILDLARHCETHFNDETGLQCIICHRFFKFKITLIEHLRIHTGEKPHFCLKCSKSFIRRSDFIKHLKDQHEADKQEFCGACGESFPNKSSFWKHSRDTTTPKKCPHCELEFINCRLLKQHIHRHLTKEERKVFVCQYCGISYTNRDQLKSHINTHTGQKPFKCLICPSAFTSRSALQKHRKSHENQRAFQCEVCSKMFNLHADLNRHRRIHTAQKDWKCDVCNKSFNQAGNLKVHQRIHSGEKPYKCDVCGQEFMYKGLFNDHLKKHVNQPGSIINDRPIIKSENV